MKKQVHDDIVIQLRHDKATMRRITMGMLLITILMTFITLGSVGREKTIITPPVVNKTFWIESGVASPEYIQLMAHWFVGLAMNVTPENVDFQKDLILRYTRSILRPKLKSKLDADAEYIKRNNISQVFYITKVAVKPGTMKAFVVGNREVYVGQARTNKDVKYYLVEFSMDDGRILLNKLEETTRNEPFKEKV